MYCTVQWIKDQRGKKRTKQLVTAVDLFTEQKVFENTYRSNTRSLGFFRNKIKLHPTTKFLFRFTFRQLPIRQ